MKKTVFTGLQPTNGLHIGNYLGAIKKFLKLQEENECYISIVDLHAITVRQDAEELRNTIKTQAAMYIAAGVDPEKATIFIQSMVPAHTELAWYLNCNSYMGELSRMTQFKDKTQKGVDSTVGLFTYPLLMASDILLYDTEIVPVGKDQLQHVELTRNIAERFNNKYGDIFKIPQGVVDKNVQSIRSLRDPEGSKMSKSDPIEKATIKLIDNEKDIMKKIKSATTDSDDKIVYDTENKIGISNLITIYAGFTDTDIESVEKKFENARYGDFKKETAEVVRDKLLQIQEKYYSLINTKELDEILLHGADKAIKKSSEKIALVKEVLGLPVIR